jgi:hypothetical protein
MSTTGDDDDDGKTAACAVGPAAAPLWLSVITVLAIGRRRRDA